MERVPPQKAAPPGAPIVTEADGVWIVQVEREGRVQEYRCSTEAQARRLAELVRTPATPRRPGR